MQVTQEAGETLIGEDRLIVMARREYMELKTHQTHGFHVFDTVPFTPFQPLCAILPSAASCGKYILLKPVCPIIRAIELRGDGHPHSLFLYLASWAKFTPAGGFDYITSKFPL